MALRPVSNPPNPWLSSEVEYLPDEMPEARLEIFEDHTRSILARNDSPDVGFDFSVNPYRGCQNACAYCLGGDTAILMGDGSTRPLRDIRVGDVIYGTERRGYYRRLVRTNVLAHWSTNKFAYRVRLEDGTQLVASGDHRFLTLRGWKHVIGVEQGPLQRPFLTTNDKLMAFGAVPEAMPETDHYKRRRYTRPNARHFFRLALTDLEALVRSRRYLAEVDVATREFRFQAATANRREWMAIGTTRRDHFERIENAVAWPTRPEPPSANRVATNVRVVGGRERMRFFQIAQTAISRKRDIGGRAIKGTAPLRVVAVEPMDVILPMFDITTGTGDFIANGVVSHNCYARPGHEYLSFGAGTDFDRKIVVKPRAPELLREAFDKKSWKGDVVVFSGVTDCYQPLEASYRLTRGCLEVCADYRNPVGIITKAPLIERDIDVLARLNEVARVGISVSVPFWDPDKARAIEPFVATPQRRIKTIARLVAAGLDVGVNVAPVIPGLGDEDIAEILTAAAAAGAKRAAFIFLRLPGPVATVFQERIRAALPLRAERILSRVREARGGKLNDPRWGKRMEGEGPYAEAAYALFEKTCKKLGLNQRDRGMGVDEDRERDEAPERPTTFLRPARAGDQLKLL